MINEIYNIYKIITRTDKQYIISSYFFSGSRITVEFFLF